jgi:hypothetical protein
MGTVRWGTAATGSDPIDWSHDGNTSAFRDEGQPGEAADAWRRIEPLVTMNDELTSAVRRTSDSIRSTRSEMT